MAVDVIDYRPRESHVDFIKELRNVGANLSKRDVETLVQYNAIATDEALKLLKDAEARGQVVASALDRYVLTKDAYMARCAHFEAKWDGVEIERKHWKCDNPAEFDEGFVKFIDSHFVRFCDLMAYEKFWLYIRQAQRWMEEETPDITMMDRVQRKRYWKKEVLRIRQNTLYALDRYAWVKEAGGMKYVANLAHCFVLYLFDDGRSAFAGKGRQMAFTTTMAAASVIRMNFRENTHVKLIACDLETTEEIYQDKILFAFDELPFWSKNKVHNRSQKLLKVLFGKNSSKTDAAGGSSKVSVVAPKITAINGGAPDVVLIDEAAFLDIFEEMVKEARPTVWRMVDGVLKQMRQVWAWSTGGRSESGNGSFEREHRDLFVKWRNGNHKMGVVPIFLDWTCRPGVTEKWYLDELKAYMPDDTTGLTDAIVEEKLIQFRQHNPSSVDDMYSISKTTIVSPTIIIRNEDKIGRLQPSLRPVSGRFDLLYDSAKKNPKDSILPYAVKGVQFVPGSDPHRDPVTMFMPPPRGWVNRTYQGTDVVVHDEGLSKQASVIYDAHFRAPLCIVNYRSRDPFESYVQCIAMGMHYRNEGERFCPELVENNIGKMYIKYKSGHEWNGLSSLVTKYRLPDYMQSGGSGGETIGFDMKAGRKDRLVQLGAEYTEAHGDNNYFIEYWRQIRTFNPTTSKTGKTTWSVDDRRKHQDDILDATWFSYLCRLCFMHAMPMELKVFHEQQKADEGEYRHVIVGNETRLVHINSREAKRWLEEEADANL